MRKSLLDQLPLVPGQIDHPHAHELAMIGSVLDQLPDAVELVHEDLSWRGGKRVDPRKGRDGLAAEQVLRIGILKQIAGFSYEELRFHTLDSNTYRTFCRLGYDKLPKKSTLQKNVKRVKAATWETINQMVVIKAKELGIERCDAVRADCTVIESNIHSPTDSSLLWDCVRVLTRIMCIARDAFGVAAKDRTKAAKRRSFKISNAKSDAQRKPLYRDLIKITDETVEQAKRVANDLDAAVPASVVEVALLQSLAADIEHFVGLANQVISQAERRVLRAESVPANEKIVSIFEPHTSIIAKDYRETEYGHKICLVSGASGMLLDVVVEDGNPNDATLTVPMMNRLVEITGETPNNASFDGGFASKENLAKLKGLGIKNVVFNKRCGLEITDMVESKPMFRKLSAFRAGVEGTISFFKRALGWTRCMWRGFESFKAYVYASAVAGNLLVLARHVLAAVAA